MALLSILQWAAQERISPQAANKRIRVHGIPRHEGKIDADEAARVFNATLDVRQQERGTAAKIAPPAASDRTGGANRRSVYMGTSSAAGRRPEIQTAIDAVKLQQRQLELKRKQGELLDRSAVESEWTRIAVQFRTAVLGLPGRIVNRIPAEYRREVLAAAEDEARQVLTALSNEIRSGQEAS